MSRSFRHSLLFAPLCLAAVACGDDSGDATILIEAEASITEGVAAGSGPDDIVDGWSVTFTDYVISVGGISLARSSGGSPEADETVRVLDLHSVSTGGQVLTELTGLAEGRWDLFQYDLVAPTASSVRDPSVAQADFDRMVAGGCTYLIKGSMTNASGQSCPPGGACRAATTIAFDLCVPAPVLFDSCVSENDLPGIAISAGGTSSAAITIHGDHLFFPGFPAGAENVTRRAQWLADSDTDGDGTVTQAELEGITAASGQLGTLLPSSDYTLSSPPFPLTNAWEYVRSQLVTQGHFQGEGECVWNVN